MRSFSLTSKRTAFTCEDLHTSYWPGHGGGYKQPDSFIEYSKNFIDYINAWHSLQKNRLDVTAFTRSVHSLHYYDSILVVEKRPIEKPSHLQIGAPVIPDYEPPVIKPRKSGFWRRLKGH